MNPGIYFDIARAQYDAIPYYNQSLIKTWDELRDIPSEFAYWLSHKDKVESKQTDSIRLGSALDCFHLGGAVEFSKRFISMPENTPKRPSKAQIFAKNPSKETLEAVAFWREFNEAARGRTIISADEYLCIVNMSASLNQSESMHGLFEHSKKAVLIANLFGFDCKGEIDIWLDRTEHIGDLKSLKDVSPTGFSKTFFDYRYDIQATFYLNLAVAIGFKKFIFNFHCVKNMPPYTTATYSFAPFENQDHSVIFQEAARIIERSIRELDDRKKSNNFADDQDWKLIRIPNWRIRRAEMEMEAQSRMNLDQNWRGTK